MKLKALMIAAALGVVGLLSGYAAAQAVTVSSSTVTTIVSSNSGRQAVCIQNAGTNNVYWSKYTSSTTANLGNIMVSSVTFTQPVCLDGFSGPLYGLAGAGATADVRYHETLR